MFRRARAEKCRYFLTGAAAFAALFGLAFPVAAETEFRYPSESEITRNRADVSQPAADPVPVSGTVFQPAGAVEGGAYDREGRAYPISPLLHGKPTANGETYDRTALTAAHPSLPLPSLVHVVNPANGRETVVRVNDRGPFEGDGLIELSDRASELLGITGNGAIIRVRYLGPAPVAVSTQMADLPEEELAGGTFAAQPLAPPIVQASAPVEPSLGVRFPPVGASGKFFVQLGAFSDIGNAERLYRNASARTNVRIVPVNVRGSDLFRVMAGPLGNRDDADRLRDDLADEGVAEGLVVSDRS